MLHYALVSLSSTLLEFPNLSLQADWKMIVVKTTEKESESMTGTESMRESSVRGTSLGARMMNGGGRKNALRKRRFSEEKRKM